MTPAITVDASKANQQMIKLVRAVGVEAKDLVRGEARMIARDLIRITPPYGTSRKSYMQGLRAVTGDFIKAVRPMKPENWSNKGIKRAIENNDTTALNKIFQNSDKLKDKRVARFHKDLHRRAQNNRHRIYRSKANKTFTTDRAAWRHRLKELQGRVGWMKSRWAVAFFALGGKRTASWIKKHTTSAQYALVDQSRLIGDVPTVTIGNLNRGARAQVGYNVERVMRRAANRMRDKFIKVMLGHKWDIEHGVVRIHKPKQEGYSA